MNKNYEKLKKDLENLIDKFNKGWHEGIEIDASDIMLLNDLMEALSAIANAPSVETVTLPDGWVAVPIYALFNQKGEMQKCSHSFEIVTNHFPMNTYPTEIWNAMFNGDANEREIQLNKIGWEVKEGYFVDKAMLVSAPTNTEVGNE